MDTLLWVVTALSLVAAVVASTIAVQVTRAERRRRAARVAALAHAAGVATITPLDAPADVIVAAAVTRAEDASVPVDLGDFAPETPRAGMAATPGLFVPPVADSGSGNRQWGLLVAAAVAAVVVGGGSLALLVSGRAPGQASVDAAAPLELVALSHARTDGELAVTGLVHNPAEGRAANNLAAEVRVFDAAGLVIATRSALVGTTALQPGTEAPFTVALGPAATAARYRVSFASNGTMLAHVDRRTNLPAAVTADAR